MVRNEIFGFCANFRARFNGVPPTGAVFHEVTEKFTSPDARKCSAGLAF